MHISLRDKIKRQKTKQLFHSFLPSGKRTKWFLLTLRSLKASKLPIWEGIVWISLQLTSYFKTIQSKELYWYYKLASFKLSAKQGLDNIIPTGCKKYYDSLSRNNSTVCTRIWFLKCIGFWLTEAVTDFIFLGSKITADSNCSHEIKRCLLLGRKAIINLDSILKTKDITVSTKVHIVKAMVFVGKVIFLLFNIHTYIHKTIKKWNIHLQVPLNVWDVQFLLEVRPICYY